MAHINARCHQALRILLNRDDRMTVERLAKELTVSKRSAYYDICRINVWLEQSGVSPLETERGRGLWIPAENREQVERLLSEQGKDEMYIFSPEERVKVIVLYLVSSGEPVFIERLEGVRRRRGLLLHVTRNASGALQSGRRMEPVGSGQAQRDEYHEGHEKALLRDYCGKGVVEERVREDFQRCPP